MRKANKWLLLETAVLTGWMACAGAARAGGDDSAAAKPVAEPQLQAVCPVQVKPAYPAMTQPTGGTVRARGTVRKGKVVAVEILTPRSVYDANVVTAMLAYECADTGQEFKAVQEFRFEANTVPVIAVARPPVAAPTTLPSPAPFPDVAPKPDAAALATLMVNDTWNEMQNMMGLMFKGLEAQFRTQGEMTRAKTIMLEEVRNALSRDLVVRVFANGLSEQMTDQELTEALAYHRSPAGRKMATFGRNLGRDPRFAAALINELCVKTQARLAALGETDPDLALMCRKK